MPIATVIGCSDSRVPPELVFDQGLGDLFVIRVAGNIVTPDVIASLIFAVGHLKTQLVIVLGHGKCGAVTLAVDELRGKQMAPLGLQILTKSILPGLQSLPKDLEAGELVETAVEQNAKWSAQQLRQLPEVSEMRASGKLMVVAAAYDLTTGKVRVLDPV